MGLEGARPGIEPESLALVLFRVGTLTTTQCHIIYKYSLPPTFSAGYSSSSSAYPYKYQQVEASDLSSHKYKDPEDYAVKQEDDTGK